MRWSWCGPTYLPTSRAVQALEQMELILIMALEPCTLDVVR